MTRAQRPSRRWEGFGGPVDYTASTRYRRPPHLYLRLQPLGWLLTRLGLSPGCAVVLEVPGRRTGLIRRTQLVRVALDGEHYLVSLAGESEWVRNVRAADGRVVLGRRERRAATLVDVPPTERPAVIRAYLRQAARTERARADAARHYFGVPDKPSDEELRRIANRYPVFRVRYGGSEDPPGAGTARAAAPTPPRRPRSGLDTARHDLEVANDAHPVRWDL